MRENVETIFFIIGILTMTTVIINQIPYRLLRIFNMRSIGFREGYREKEIEIERQQFYDLERENKELKKQLNKKK